jgi:Ferritin-like domain
VLDERRLEDLMVESQDLQSDAMRASGAALPWLEDYAHESMQTTLEPEQRAAFDGNRGALLERLGLAGLLGTGLGAALVGILSRPAAADQALDVQILQTASSLELLAVATYGAALTLPFISGGNPVIVAFAQTTMKQHDEHRAAFQAQTGKLGGKVQDQPNAKYAAVVEATKPKLMQPADVVTLATTLENVARDTYLSDLAMFSDKNSMTLMATVMGVETQHLATLRAVGALLGTAPDLISIPTDVAKLPAAAGSAGFPDAIPMPKLASPPQEGAVA